MNQQTESSVSTAQAISNLEELILSGALAPGAKIPEVSTARMLNTGRNTIREALRELAASGLVTILPHQGAFVHKHSIHEILCLFDIRAALGRLAGKKATQLITRPQILELRSLIETMDALVRSDDPDAYTGKNLEFHQLLYQVSGNERLAQLDRSLGAELRIYRRRGVAFGGLAVSNQEHRQLVDCIERGAAEEAGRQLEQHINNGRERFIQAAVASNELGDGSRADLFENKQGKT